jgi:glycosyltransferase involved in cell wall biosynthesis
MSIPVDAAPAISVIVPVYNVQDYIVESLDTIANQHFTGRFEVLLIDDCSTDNSKALCENFVAAHPTIARLISLPQNQGVAVARNKGLEAARGDYFAFVDPDDLLPPDALQNLYDAAVKHQADIVKGNNIVFDEQRSFGVDYNVETTKIYTGTEILAAFFEHKETRGHPWGKLFRRAPFANIFFTPGVLMAEDILYCAEVFARAKTLVLIDQTVYQYRLRQTSSTGRKFETGAYLWWLYGVENSGNFATTPNQEAHFKGLQIQTLLQLVREARALQGTRLAEVVKELHTRQRAWKISALGLLLNARISRDTLVHFLKYKYTLTKLNYRLLTQ